MKVRAEKSFGGNDGRQRCHHSAGDVFDLPDGVDWIQAGLVTPLERETASIQPGERASLPHARPRNADPRPVTDIDGIGAARADELAGLGVYTVADLAAIDPALVEATIERVSLAQVEAWQQAAREMAT